RRLSVADLRIEAAAVDQEDNGPAVVVVIEERRATAHFLKQKLLVIGAAGDVPGARQAGGSGDVHQHDGTRRLAVSLSNGLAVSWSNGLAVSLSNGEQ